MGKSNKKIIILEGLPASGKTTIANYLVQNLNFYKVNESIGKLSDQNITNDQIKIFRETLNKYEKAKRVDSNCIIDRGYPSLLCWDYCAEKLGYAKDYSEKNKWVKESLAKGELFEPDLYIYLDIDPGCSLGRRLRKTTKIDVWSGHAGMRYSREFYDNFFMDKSNVIKIDGKLEPEETSKKIEQRLYEKN